MQTTLSQILIEAADWLTIRNAEETSAEEERALDQFGKFLVTLSENDAPPKLETACWLIGRWMVDQPHWNGSTFAGISMHVQRVHQYARDEAWRRHKLGVGA